jgi:hypothetical protein
VTTDCGTGTLVLKKPASASIWNILLGMPTVCACVTVVVWPPAVTPLHTGGSVGSVEPSKSFCGSGVAVDDVGFTPGMPLAPGYRPYRLSKPRFSA